LSAHPHRPRTRTRPGSPGFTLIELLAVVLIIALMATLVMPRMSVRSGRLVREEARRLAADLEFARQQTLVTGIPYRVFIDLEGEAWRVEWYVTEARALGQAQDASAAPASATADPTSGDDGEPDLAPPRGAERAFYPVPSALGRVEGLEQAIHFAEVRTPTARVTKGNVVVAFALDGTADPTSIVLTDDDGHRVVVDVEPLEDTVGIRNDDTK
jgi:type II secretion system protein H